MFLHFLFCIAMHGIAFHGVMLAHGILLHSVRLHGVGFHRVLRERNRRERYSGKQGERRKDDDVLFDGHDDTPVHLGASGA
ncbi:hypothetical protein D3C80_2108760 [compost metagenome]